MGPGTIVVGADGSASGMTAVRWAAATAGYTDRALEILVAYHWEVPGRWYGGARDMAAAADERAGAIAASAQEEAERVAPRVDVTTSLLPGDPAPVLLRAAGHADLLVVGNRGRGGFSGLLLGSVSVHVAMHAPGPVAVVRGHADHRFDPVVVGVDLAHPAERAIGVAFEQAAARGCALQVVTAHPVPVPAAPVGLAPITYDPPAVREELHAQLVRRTTGWREKYPDVPLDHVVVERSPRADLVDRSGTAQLVVVGSRGHGGVGARLLGSLGLYLLHHAACPVLVAHG